MPRDTHACIMYIQCAVALASQEVGTATIVVKRRTHPINLPAKLAVHKALVHELGDALCCDVARREAARLRQDARAQSPHSTRQSKAIPDIGCE